MDILFPLPHISPEAKPSPFPSCGLNPLSRVTVGTSEFRDTLEQTMWHACQQQTPKHGTCMWNLEHVRGQAVRGKFSHADFYQTLEPRSAQSHHRFCPGLPTSASPHCWWFPVTRVWRAASVLSDPAIQTSSLMHVKEWICKHSILEKGWESISQSASRFTLLHSREGSTARMWKLSYGDWKGIHSFKWRSERFHFK